jgi:hypothetical protein
VRAYEGIEVEEKNCGIVYTGRAPEALGEMPTHASKTFDHRDAKRVFIDLQRLPLTDSGFWV